MGPALDSNTEQRRNEIAMKTVGKMLSRYRVDPTDPGKGNVLVVTSAAWDSSLVQLEGESA